MDVHENIYLPFATGNYFDNSPRERTIVNISGILVIIIIIISIIIDLCKSRKSISPCEKNYSRSKNYIAAKICKYTKIKITKK